MGEKMIEGQKKEIVRETIKIALHSWILFGFIILVAVKLLVKDWIFAILFGVLAAGTYINIATIVAGIKIDLDVLEILSRAEEIKGLDATIKGLKKGEIKQCGT